MGYLSCKAESSVSISKTQINSESSSKNKALPLPPILKNEKPIKIQEFNYSDLEAATNKFSPQKLLGRGSHGCVYEAVLKNGRHVAVKRTSRKGNLPNSTSTSKALIVTSNERNPNEVENEIEILSNIRNPRLVNLLGFTNDSNDRLLVVEFMSNGTLYDILHSSPRIPNWGKRIRWALQTAKAIELLHCSNPPVIHRDIKSANVLIDGSFNARLGDFGLALRCHVDDYYRLRSTPPAGTMGYLDPGYVTPDNLSTKTDVFSFGILLLEIISGRKAIDVAHSPPSVVDWAIPLIRREKHLVVFDPRIEPPKDPLLCRQLAVIAAKCVRICKERRPSMSDVVTCLSGLSKLLPSHSWTGFSNPCLMVESVGCAVGNTQLSVRPRNWEEGNINGLDAVFSRPLVNSRRVYSDLGVRKNLMDLMAGTDEDSCLRVGDDKIEPKSKSKSASSRFGIESGGVVSRRSQRSYARGDDKRSIFDLIQNQSFGESGDMCSRRLG